MTDSSKVCDFNKCESDERDKVLSHNSWDNQPLSSFQCKSRNNMKCVIKCESDKEVNSPVFY